jgi:ElaB/YqjD/DUF883 family membrane-anchored ribosome-binding protein
MEVENKKSETAKQQVEEESGIDSADAQSAMERGVEAYGQAEQAVIDAYDKTSKKVSDTYEKTKSYSNENQGKTVLVALGIGVGLGLLLGASSRQSRTRRIARPAIHALSDMALAFFR